MDKMNDLEKNEINESDLEQVTGGGLFDRTRRTIEITDLLFRDKEEDDDEEAKVVLLPAPPTSGKKGKNTSGKVIKL